MSEARKILADKIIALRKSLGYKSRRKFSKILIRDRMILFRLEHGTQPSIDIDDLFMLVGLGLEIKPLNSDKDLRAFEELINADRELMSRFF